MGDHATYRNFLDYLKELEKNNDSRLDDTMRVWDMATGEYPLAEFVEFVGEDEFLEDGHIFIAIHQDGEQY